MGSVRIWTASMDSTMLKFLSLMTAASVAETESKDKMKGKIPKYPATAEPLDEGNSTVWMKWEPDFKTYANINNLAPLLTPPHYGKVQIPAEIENGPAEPTPPARRSKRWSQRKPAK